MHYVRSRCWAAAAVGGGGATISGKIHDFDFSEFQVGVLFRDRTSNPTEKSVRGVPEKKSGHWITVSIPEVPKNGSFGWRGVAWDDERGGR